MANLKPHKDSLPEFAQHAVQALENVLTDLISKNPKLAQEEKLAQALGDHAAFKGRGHEMHAHEHHAEPQRVASVPVVDTGKGTGRQV